MTADYADFTDSKESKGGFVWKHNRHSTRRDRFEIRTAIATMRAATIVLCLLTMLVVCATAQSNPAPIPAQKRHIVIGAGTLLDGRGHILRDTRIVVEGSKIVALDPKASPVD